MHPYSKQRLRDTVDRIGDTYGGDFLRILGCYLEDAQFNTRPLVARLWWQGNEVLRSAKKTLEDFDTLLDGYPEVRLAVPADFFHDRSRFIAGIEADASSLKNVSENAARLFEWYDQLYRVFYYTEGYSLSECVPLRDALHKVVRSLSYMTRAEDLRSAVGRLQGVDIERAKHAVGLGYERYQRLFV